MVNPGQGSLPKNPREQHRAELDAEKDPGFAAGAERPTGVGKVDPADVRISLLRSQADQADAHRETKRRICLQCADTPAWPQNTSQLAT